MAKRNWSVCWAARVLAVLLFLNSGARSQPKETSALAPDTSPSPPVSATPSREPAPEASSGQAKNQAIQDLSTRFHNLLDRPGGLTSRQVASRAVITSFQVRAREQEAVAAAAEVDKVLLRYIP